MFNIGMPELVLVFIIALLLFGPRKLPQIGRMLGKFMREFRKAADDFREAINEEPPQEDTRETGEQLKPYEQEYKPGEKLGG